MDRQAFFGPSASSWTSRSCRIHLSHAAPMIALKASVRGVLVRLPTEPQRQVAVTDKQRVYTWNPGNGFSVLDRFRRFNHHDGRDTLVPLIQVCLDPFHADCAERALPNGRIVAAGYDLLGLRRRIDQGYDDALGPGVE